MPQFLVDASYRTRGGNMARWSTSVLAVDMRSAQREAYQAITSRHRGATKIDLRIMADLLSSGRDHSPAVPGRLATTSVQNGR
ncbi:hypothetical protein [Novosphingobium soli]|uniref:Uncharacterized protein n=1 Tax=Novosphingobium soli TaxID=574956 RepID=A0ABV6CVK7_9SPHN